MGFSTLRDIFSGRIGVDYCVRSLLYLRSPNNVKEYLLSLHRVTFKEGDSEKKRKWSTYPKIVGASNVVPIKEKDLVDSQFMTSQSEKLSFDISRFAEFLDGYRQVAEDIKPIMLHYSVVYLFDFFSRSWLKYSENRSHGITSKQPVAGSSVSEYVVQLEKNGVFPRAVDAFYFINQSSLFSPDADDGIGYQRNTLGGIISNRIEKMKYSETPTVNLHLLVNMYERLGKIIGSVSPSNYILTGYALLFTISSISRYRAKDWFEIRENKDMKNTVDLLQYDFLYKWVPEILMQTILRKDLKNELSIASS